MPTYTFVCPVHECSLAADAPSPHAVVRCYSGMHDDIEPPVMRRRYAAPALTSSAIPTRYRKEAR
jgi:hypothetical protein